MRKDHPNSLFWRVFLPAPLPPAYLDFVPEAALHHQRLHIKQFYRQPPQRSLDRPYPFLNAAVMDRFVSGATGALRSIQEQWSAGPEPDGTSVLQWLPPDALAPYPAPLGDSGPAEDAHP